MTRECPPIKTSTLPLWVSITQFPAAVRCKALPQQMARQIEHQPLPRSTVIDCVATPSHPTCTCRGFTNTSAVKSAISFIDGDKGILRYRGYPMRAAGRAVQFHRGVYRVSERHYPPVFWPDCWGTESCMIKGDGMLGQGAAEALHCARRSRLHCSCSAAMCAACGPSHSVYLILRHRWPTGGAWRAAALQKIGMPGMSC